MAIPPSIGRRGQRLPGRRGLAAAATLGALTAGGLAAYATVGGSGVVDPATEGLAALAIPSSTVGPLTPQINAADTTPLTVTIDNPGPAALKVGEITGQVRSSDGCESAWFTVAPVDIPGGLVPGEHSYASSVILNDNDRDQKACTLRAQTIDWTAH